MTFDEALGDAGFELLDARRDGTRRFTRRTNPYLRWWLIVGANGNVDLSWEFELGEYMKAKRSHVSVQDELSLLLFPRDEIRGPAEVEWLQEEIRRAELQLASIDLLAGS